MILKKWLAKNYINAVGWSTKRKLLVIESDDWGSIRMPNREVLKQAKLHGFKLESSNYDRFDSIESKNDFEAIYDTLNSIKDVNNNSLCITACSVVANPNFGKIREAKKERYFYETILETYERYPRCDGAFSLFKDGMKSNIFYPQFHGREHINVRRYLRAINSTSIKEKFCFENNAILGSLIDGDMKHSYFGALDYSDRSEEMDIELIISDGLLLFQKIFGFPSKSFVTPTNHQGLKVNSYFADNKVLFCQGGSQNIRNFNGKLIRFEYKWGHVDENGVTYWRRNCTFEPSRDQDFDWVSSCLKEIEIAFRWGKPAVINSHRVNYIGSLDEMNRTLSLKKLKDLIVKVKNRWPEVEFINSAELSNIISE